MAVFALLVLIGKWLKISLFCGAFGLCCGNCAVFACLIVTGVFRYSTEGNLCADTVQFAAVPDQDEIFMDHGDKIAALFIAQAILYCFYSCCTAFTFQLGFMVNMMTSMQGAM